MSDWIDQLTLCLIYNKRQACAKPQDADSKAILDLAIVQRSLSSPSGTSFFY